MRHFGSGRADLRDTGDPLREAIADAGCFGVTYYFHKDGDLDYFSPEKPSAPVNQEFIAVTEDAPGRIVLQHATVGEGGKAAGRVRIRPGLSAVETAAGAPRADANKRPLRDQRGQ